MGLILRQKITEDFVEQLDGIVSKYEEMVRMFKHRDLSDIAEAGRRSLVLSLEQKQITAWLQLRNDAAHGHYDRYEFEQVKAMIIGIRISWFL